MTAITGQPSWISEIDSKSDPDFQALKPLDDPADLPAFPIDSFPPGLGDYVNDLATETQTPIDLAASMALGVLATAAQGSQIVVEGNWEEPLCLYIAVGMPSGQRKTAVVKRLAKPLRDLEKELWESERYAVQKYESSKRMLQKRQAALEEQAASPRSSDAVRVKAYTQIAQVIEEQNQLVPVVESRLLADSVTPESLVKILSNQSGRLGILSDEGGIFGDMAGRYSKMSNLDPWLKGHTGEPYSSDRIGREHDYVPRITLTTCVAVQPEVMIEALTNAEYVSRGLIGRFLLSAPRARTTVRDLHPTTVSQHLEDTYNNLVKDITRITRPTQVVLRLSNEAATEFDRLQRDLEPKYLPGGELAQQLLCGWANKLPGAVARIAGLLHMAENPTCFSGRDISGSTMVGAVNIGYYYLSHFKELVRSHAPSEDLRHQRLLVEWIKRTGVKTFSTRDAQRSNARVFVTVESVLTVLDSLMERGYVKQQSPDKSAQVGRPVSTKWLVNPKILE